MTEIEPPIVIKQRERRPRSVGDYSFYGLNDESLPLAATESMQFGHAFERFLRELLLANIALGLLFLSKTDISDGFYQIDFAPSYIPKLGLVFPQSSLSSSPEDQLVFLPLVLPMGWGNSPPILTTATETVEDITNAAIHSKEEYRPRTMECLASELNETLVSTSLAKTLDNTSLAETLDINSKASPSTSLVEILDPYPDAATTP